MPWTIAFHIIFVVTWFAALFYLPRLFIYHADCTDAISNARFKIMERRLFRGIMLPSSVLVFISGLHLLFGYAWQSYHHTVWLPLKLFLVLLLYGYVGVCWKYIKDFKNDCNRHSARFYRFFNEVPSVLLIVIIILVIVKPA